MSAFTPEEVEFFKHAAFFSWKERLTKEIARIFERLYEVLAVQLDPSSLLVPPEMDFSRKQIVRGERFEELPYAYLDFPQYFSRRNKFTYRSMFWWGHGCFFALILEGDHLDQYRRNLLDRYDDLADRGLSLSLAPTPWEWRSRGPNVLPIQGDNRADVMRAIASRGVLKIQSFLPLDALSEHDDAIVTRAVETFTRLRPIVRRGPDA